MSHLPLRGEDVTSASEVTDEVTPRERLRKHRR